MDANEPDLKAFLPFLRHELPRVAFAAADSEAEGPSLDRLIDLLEGRLNATEREDLLEQVVSHPEALNAFGDLLHGYRWKDTVEDSKRPGQETVRSPLEKLKGWLDECRFLLAPAVTAYSAATVESPNPIEFAKENNLYRLIDFDNLDESFRKMVREIESLLDEGFHTGELFNIQAGVMEVHLVLSRDRGGDPRAFFQVWGRLCETVGNLKGFEEWDSSEFIPDWRAGYDLIRNVYEKAIELDPEQGEIYVGLGRIDLSLGDYDRAEANLKKGVSLNPSEAAAYHLLARLRDLRGGR